MNAVRWAHRHRTVVAMACAAAVLAGCSSSEEGDFPGNDRPGFLVGEQRFVYDGTTDDLLTAGLGKTGLGGSTAPGFVNPAAPTATELRRSAIWNNYRAIVDVSPKGGYGILYGPNLDANGQDTLGEGRIAGVEYVGLADDGTGTKNVTLVVQIPNNWNRSRPCIVTGTSSGSRGVYGAIGSSGEWGLKRGCAVAYADKGTGNGVHDLATDTVNLVDGTRTTSTAAGKGSNFTSITGSALTSFNTASPNRIAVKHAHSQQNPEKDWGANTLNAIQFAIWALNQEYNQITPDGYVQAVFNNTNTIVIAASVSNGAGAAIAAAEQDEQNLIDGIAVSEPNVALPDNPNLRVVRGTRVLVGAGRPLYDYFTYANLLQPCAALSARAAGSPGAAFVSTATATNRCASLKAKGVLTTATTSEQADEALDLLLAYGWDPETTKLHASHYAFATPAIAMTYANTYSRASVSENLCGFSFAGVDGTGRPAPLRRELARAGLRHRQRRAADVGHPDHQQPERRRTHPRRHLDFAVDRPHGLQHRRRAVPAQPVDGHRRGRDQPQVRRQRDAAQRQPARQAGDHRAWPLRHAGAAGIHVAPLLRPEPDHGGRGVEAHRTSR